MNKIILKCQCGYNLQFPCVTPNNDPLVLEVNISYCPICNRTTKEKILECWFAELIGIEKIKKQTEIPQGKELLDGIERGFQLLRFDQ